MAHQAEAYPGFSSMKRLGVFLLPPGWDASPSQGYPQHQIRGNPFIHLGEERHCGSEVSCPRTQHNVPGQGSNPEPLDPESSALTMRPPRSHYVHVVPKSPIKITLRQDNTLTIKLVFVTRILFNWHLEEQSLTEV